MDSLEYYTNHVNREIPEVNLTEEEVEEKLNPNLAIKRTRLVIIPDSGLTEQLCFEIDANLEDERFLIYINAINGKEEQILKVVETEDGTMTM